MATNKHAAFNPLTTTKHASFNTLNTTVNASFPPGTPGVSSFFFHFNDANEIFQSFPDPGTFLNWLPGDGSPLNGCLSFTATAAGTVKGLSNPITWETLGVPSGATVVQVGIKGYRRRLAAISGMSAQWALQIVGADNNPAHDGISGVYLEFTVLTTSVQGAWEIVPPLTWYSVHGAYSASNAPIFVKLWYFPAGTGSIDWRLDEIELDVVYVPRNS